MTVTPSIRAVKIEKATPPRSRLTGSTAAAAPAPPAHPDPIPVAPTPAATNRSNPPRVNTALPLMPLTLPFVEMFGFDGDNELLGDDDFLPTVTAYAPTQAIQAPARPETAPPLVAATATRARTSIFDSIPRLSDIGSLASGENTGTLIERLWEATGEIEALDGTWNSGPSSSRLQNQNHRWGLIGVVISTVAVIILAALNFGPEAATAPELSPARQAIQDAAGTIDDLELISGYLADPSTPSDSLSGAAVMLAGIDRAAGELATAASSLTPWDGYQEVASALSTAAEQGSAIEDRLGAALSYRLVSDTIFALPELPTTATGPASAQLGFELATMMSDAERAVTRLPRDPSLVSHRLATETLIVDLFPQIDRYLEALRNEDAVIAAATANDIIERIVANRQTRTIAYDQFDAEIMRASASYGEALQTAGELLNARP